MVSYLSWPAWIIEVDAEYVFRQISDPDVIGRARNYANVRYRDHCVDVVRQRRDPAAQDFMGLIKKLDFKVMWSAVTVVRGIQADNHSHLINKWKTGTERLISMLIRRKVVRGSLVGIYVVYLRDPELRRSYRRGICR